MTLSTKPAVFDVKLYTPISSSNRSHRIIKLNNNLLALLISDPSETVASCAVAIATGSHNDPAEIPGLAHFCEHMVLSSGSKRHPEPNAFHENLSKNNGSQNAHTSGEQTCFYFELPSSKSSDSLVFDQIVGILADALKDPIFHDVLINKEIYAINSEHVGNKSSLSKMMYHATRLLASPEHPFHQFGTGNIFTLTNMPKLHKLNLKHELTKYFREHFFAENMVLCLRGPLSLNQLSKIAQARFADIPSIPTAQAPKLLRWRSSSSFDKRRSSSARPLDSFQILKDAWSARYAKKPVFDKIPMHNSIMVQSNKSPVVRFVFPINSFSTRFTDRELATYTQVWCELLGDESEGSLCHYLKYHSFITELVAYSSSFAVNDTGLILQLHLTNQGWLNVQEIIPLLWKYLIPAILNAPLSLLAQYISELNSLDLLKFLYQEIERSPMDRCADLCEILLQDLSTVDLSFLLKSTMTYFECNNLSVANLGSFTENQTSKDWWRGEAVKFQAFVNEFMSQDTVRVILLGNLSKCYFNCNPDSLTTDTYFEYEYGKIFIDLEALTCDKIDYHFTVPGPNPFMVPVGHKLSFIKHALLASSVQSENSALSVVAQTDLVKAPPRLAGKNSYYELWLKEEDMDLSFRSKSIFTMEFISTTLQPAPEYTMHLEILGQLLHSLLGPTLYPAERAGYTYELSLSSKGDVRFGLTISGFTDGILNLLKIIVEAIVNLSQDVSSIPKDIFRKARVLVRTKYEEASSESCVTLASLGLLILLENCMWPLEDRLDALEDIYIESFRSFLEKFISGDKYLNILIQGSDMSIADDINEYLNERLTHHLSNADDNVCRLFEPATYIIPEGSNLFFKRDGFHDDPNNSIVYFIQTGERENNYIYTLTVLTEFIMSQTLVPDLRQKKQIGYIVLGGLRVLSDTVGLHITTMAGSPPEFLEEKINEYLAYLEDMVLSKLTALQFKQDYVDELLGLLNSNSLGKLEKTSGPANLLSQIEANVHSGQQNTSLAMKSHKRLRTQISYRRYNFDEDDEPVDARTLQNLTLSEYMRFFRKRISIYSSTRAKLSIMVSSVMSKEEVQGKMLYLQIESFLKMKGFNIPAKDLNAIVQKSRGKPTALLKGLLSYFRSQGESLKLLSTVLREVVKQLLSKVTPESPSAPSGTHGSLQAMSQQVTPAISLEQVPDVNSYRSKISSCK
ncbi:AaceriAGR251Cp [[Ashbya] aceris (nom. inval.)]|nr:AaceriAGR251Cp [[Ashbya] aceris (nom. inval.)]